jgi:arylsulfatase
MRWPGKIPAARVSSELISTMDFLPTAARLIGAELPAKRIDGLNIWDVVVGKPGAVSPREAFYYYAGDELQAVRSGDWKLHLPHEYLSPAVPAGKDGKPANFANLKPESMQMSGLRGIASRHGYIVKKTDLALYDLKTDIGEAENVAADHPEIVKRLLKYVEAARADLGDSLTKRTGANVRSAGKL